VRELLGGAGEGIELEEAPSVGGAVTERCGRGGIDCVLTGHDGGAVDARQMLAEMRRARLATPLLVLTSRGDAALAVALIKGGACDYLIPRQTSGAALATCLREAARCSQASSSTAAAGAAAAAGDVPLAEERLLQATRSRDEAVALLDTLVGGAPVGIAFFDTELRYVRVNRELARINGLSAEAHLGKTLYELLPGMDPQVGRDLGQVLRSGEPIVDIDVSGETPAEPGVQHDWIVSYYPVRSTTGELLGVGATVVDITDRKRHSRELAQAKEVAEAANRSKDQFLAVLSHELRTPLTPVLMAVQSLQEANVSAELKGMLAMIRRNVELEARLIDDLLDLTRIAKGKLQLHLEMIDAHELIQSALDICRGEIEAKQIEVTVDLAARRHIVYADSARLQQVFWNLINNAIKFTPAGGRLRLRSLDEGERLVTEVMDSGIGIDAETLPRIFGAFEQGEGTITRRFGGLGLGLAICRALVRMHWGTITAASAGKGKGSTFMVTLGGHLPTSIVHGDLHPGKAITSTPQVKPAGQGASARRVLMVDDHADTRTAMRKLLERSGYTVTTADSVQGAIKTAGDDPIDILISDIGLPDGSGLEIMRHFRSRSGANVRGIALSGFGMEEDIRKSREAGFEHHLTKPVTFDRLHSVLKELEGTDQR
jgi:two-component system CheB/CheR fusion protein